IEHGASADQDPARAVEPDVAAGGAAGKLAENASVELDRACRVGRNDAVEDGEVGQAVGALEGGRVAAGQEIDVARALGVSGRPIDGRGGTADGHRLGAGGGAGKGCGACGDCGRALEGLSLCSLRRESGGSDRERRAGDEQLVPLYAVRRVQSMGHVSTSMATGGVTKT